MDAVSLHGGRDEPAPIVDGGDQRRQEVEVGVGADEDGVTDPPLGGLDPARIDEDDPTPAQPHLTHLLHHVRDGDETALAGPRIRTDHQQEVRAGDVGQRMDGAGAVDRLGGHELVGAVLGASAEQLADAEPMHEAVEAVSSNGVEPERIADVGSQRVGAVTVDDAAETSGDVGHGDVPGGLRPRTVGAPPDRVVEPVGVVVDIERGDALRTRETLGDRVIPIRFHADEAPAVDLGQQATRGLAHAAEGAVNGAAHVDRPYFLRAVRILFVQLLRTRVRDVSIICMFDPREALGTVLEFAGTTTDPERCTTMLRSSRTCGGCSTAPKRRSWPPNTMDGHHRLGRSPPVFGPPPACQHRRLAPRHERRGAHCVPRPGRHAPIRRCVVRARRGGHQSCRRIPRSHRRVERRRRCLDHGRQVDGRRRLRQTRRHDRRRRVERIQRRGPSGPPTPQPEAERLPGRRRHAGHPHRAPSRGRPRSRRRDLPHRSELWRSQSTAGAGGGGGGGGGRGPEPTDLVLTSSRRYTQLMADALVVMTRRSIHGTWRTRPRQPLRRPRRRWS